MAVSPGRTIGPVTAGDRCAGSELANEHHFAAHLVWTGAARGPTSSYEAYSRDYRAQVEGKPPLEGSSDPTFRGDASRYNPEDLLVLSLSACHMLSYLHLCASAGIEVVAYEDRASGTMAIKDRKMRFVDILLEPKVTIAKGTGRKPWRSTGRRMAHASSPARSISRCGARP